LLVSEIYLLLGQLDEDYLDALGTGYSGNVLTIFAASDDPDLRKQSSLLLLFTQTEIFDLLYDHIFHGSNLILFEK